MYGLQALSLRLGQSIAIHFDFVLKRTVPISLFRFVCVLHLFPLSFSFAFLATHLITHVY
jgi:hypothetical protein